MADARQRVEEAELAAAKVRQRVEGSTRGRRDESEGSTGDRRSHAAHDGYLDGDRRSVEKRLPCSCCQLNLPEGVLTWTAITARWLYRHSLVRTVVADRLLPIGHNRAYETNTDPGINDPGVADPIIAD
jgi:hypothetical protein